jgi:hypothetical protein
MIVMTTEEVNAQKVICAEVVVIVMIAEAMIHHNVTATTMMTTEDVANTTKETISEPPTIGAVVMSAEEINARNTTLTRATIAAEMHAITDMVQIALIATEVANYKKAFFDINILPHFNKNELKKLKTMKKITAIAALLFSMNILLAQTTTTDYNSVPNNISQQFKKDYPNSSAEWVVDGDNNYLAEFKNPTTKGSTIVVYDRDGRLVRTESEIADKSYPNEIDNYYSKQFPNAQYKVWSSKDARGNSTYYIKHNGDVHWFDKEGKFTSSKRESTHRKVKPMK